MQQYGQYASPNIKKNIIGRGLNSMVTESWVNISLFLSSQAKF